MSYSFQYAFYLLITLLCASCATEFQPTEGVYIPRNFEEAYAELDEMLTYQEKESLRTGETPTSEMVLNFGMQLKEYWGLWQDSKMAKFMHKNDVKHPDQMITIIFDGYVTHLKKQVQR